MPDQPGVQDPQSRREHPASSWSIMHDLLTALTTGIRSGWVSTSPPVSDTSMPYLQHCLKIELPNKSVNQERICDANCHNTPVNRPICNQTFTAMLSRPGGITRSCEECKADEMY